MGQWWGTHLSIQETQVPSLGRSHMLGATKHVCHNYWACVLKSRSHNYWAHMWHQLLKPWHPRTHVRQQERSPGWDTHGLQVESSPFLPQLEKSPRSKEDPAQAKLHKQKLLKKKKKEFERMSPQTVSWSPTFLKMWHLINTYLLNTVSFSSSQQGKKF